MGNKRFIDQDGEPQPNYFKAWRVYRHFRQVDVEKILKMNKGRISNLERGAVWNRHVLQALARVYGCTPAQLLSEPPPGNTTNHSSLNKQIEITAANLTRLVDLANELRAAATILRDRVVPQIDALVHDLAQAGEAATAAVGDAEQLAATMTEYKRQQRAGIINGICPGERIRQNPSCIALH